MTVELVVGSTWDGAPLPPDERAVVQLDARPDGLLVRGLAPWAGDPPPTTPPGPTPGLWEHEVLELFLVGDDGRYLEVELGPHGHHLVLQLADVRRPAASELPLSLRVARVGAYWLVEAHLPRFWLPRSVVRANAFHIHGPRGARAYRAATPLPGERPDFHQPTRFAPVRLPAAPATPREAWDRLIAALGPEAPPPAHLPPADGAWCGVGRTEAPRAHSRAPRGPTPYRMGPNRVVP